jgi:DNA-binding Lrp family transcriptional regulator
MANTSTRTGHGPVSVHLDEQDHRLLRCLQLAPRAPFSCFAEVLGVSEQTVARRYRRMRESGIVRVSAVVSAEALGETTWLVRVACQPNGARKLAQALAQRDDIGWVFLAGAGNEVIFAVRSRTAAVREDLLLKRIPSTTPVIGLTSAVALHEFPAGPRSGGHHLGVTLDPDCEARLAAEDDPSPDATHGLLVDDDALQSADWALIKCLEADGRSSYATLAASSALTASTAARRTQWLLGCGIVSIEVDIAPHAVDRSINAQIWMSAPPAHLERCGRAVADLPEVVFTAAVSGIRNLVASVSCTSQEDLYHFITVKLAAVADLADIEVVPTIAMLKQATSLVDQKVLTS